MNARQLAMRDPARAALMGAISGVAFGFGADYSRRAPVAPPPQALARHRVGFGDDYGFGFGPGGDPYNQAPPGVGFGFGGVPDLAQFEYGFGDDYGFGAARHRRRHPAHPAHPAHAQNAAAAWAHSPANPTSTAARTNLLDPNKDSLVKVTRYSFSFSPASALVLGTASSMGTFTQQPSTSVKGQRVVTNAPIPGFVFLTTLQIANVNVFVGTTEDAYTYNAGAQNVILDLPRLDPQNRATGAGSYSGVLPPGYTAGNSFTFIITIQGPATMAGGYGQ